MFKSISLMLLILAQTFNASSQAQKKTEPPNLRLTLSVEKTSWLLFETVPVKITIENLSGKKVALPSNVYFRVENTEPESVRVSKSNGNAWSPVSLTKTYSKDAQGCQNDLTAERVGVFEDTNIVAISPPKHDFILRKNEKKEFSFDLSKTCWSRASSSLYPNGSLFTYLDGTHTAKMFEENKYKVYFEMGFTIESAKPEGSATPTNRYKRLRSNEVVIVYER